MRIIAGDKKGMKLLPPKTRGTRPITDRVKESVFSILFNKGMPEGSLVADIFCGTGSLGLEALSRGADFCQFEEKSPQVVEILNKNIQRTGFIKQSKVLQTNVFKVGAPPETDTGKFDLIFIDPPYKLSLDSSENSPLGRLLFLLNHQVTENGFAVVKTDHRVDLVEAYGSLEVIDERKWGNTKVFFLQNKPESGQKDV